MRHRKWKKRREVMPESSDNAGLKTEVAGDSEATENHAPLFDSAIMDGLNEVDSRTLMSLDRYIGVTGGQESSPWITLTYATSLDGMIASAPGVQTALSGSRSKSMTHYMRMYHEAIVVGARTAISDDPSLNCRVYQGGNYVEHPRPIVLDRHNLWNPENSKMVKVAQQRNGLFPWIVNSRFQGTADFNVKDDSFDSEGGGPRDLVKYLKTPDKECSWPSVFAVLKEQGCRRVMIEGGASVINRILADHADLITSIVITIAPTFLGKEGARIAPQMTAHTSAPDGSMHRALKKLNLEDVQWLPVGKDVMMCAYVNGYNTSREEV